VDALQGIYTRLDALEELFQALLKNHVVIAKTICELRAQLTSEKENHFMTPTGTTYASALAGLQAQVAEQLSVEQSAITLIQGLAQQIAANANDPAALTSISAQLNTSATALAAAITANTPSATSTPAAPPATPAPSAPSSSGNQAAA
jgi:hypothetical protein